MLLYLSITVSTAQQSNAGPNSIGLSVRPAQTAFERSAVGSGGLLVAKVTPGSFAASIGLYPGTIVFEINRLPVATTADYQRAIASLKPGDDIVFVISDPHQKGHRSLVGGTLPRPAGRTNPTAEAAVTPAAQTAPADDLEAQALAHLNGGNAAASPATSSDLEAQALAHLGGGAPSGTPATSADLEAQALQAMHTNEVEAEHQHQLAVQAQEERAEQANLEAMQASQQSSPSIGTSGGGGFLNALNSALGVVNNGLDAQIAQNNARNAQLQAQLNAQIAANNARRERQAAQQQAEAAQEAQQRAAQQQATSSGSTNRRLCNSAQGSQGLLEQGCGVDTAPADTAQTRTPPAPARLAANTLASSSAAPAPNPGGRPNGANTGTAPPANCVFLSDAQPCVPLAQYQQMQAQQPVRVPVEVCPGSGFVPGLMRRVSSDVSEGVPCTPGQPIDPSIFSSGSTTNNAPGTATGAPGSGASSASGTGLGAGASDPNLNNCMALSYKTDSITGTHLLIQNNCSIAAHVYFYASPEVYGGSSLAPGEIDNTYQSQDKILAAGGVSLYACPLADTPRKADGSIAYTGVDNAFFCSRK